MNLPVWLNDCLDDGAKVDMNWVNEARNALAEMRDEMQKVYSCYVYETILQSAAIFCALFILMMFVCFACRCCFFRYRRQDKKKKQNEEMQKKEMQL